MRNFLFLIPFFIFFNIVADQTNNLITLDQNTTEVLGKVAQISNQDYEFSNFEVGTQLCVEDLQKLLETAWDALEMNHTKIEDPQELDWVVRSLENCFAQTLGKDAPLTRACGEFWRGPHYKKIFFRENCQNGKDEVCLQAPNSLPECWCLTLPVDGGDPGQILTTDGNGITTWEDANSVGHNPITIGTPENGLSVDGSQVLTLSTTADVTFNSVTTDLVKLNDNDTNFIGLQAPTNVGTNYTLTLPETVGSTSQVLRTSAGDPEVFEWVTISAGGSDIFNGGQTGAVVVGTNDANSVSLETNGTTRLTIDGAGEVSITKNLNLPNTSDANTGVIEKNGNRFIHNYGTDNMFVGENAGNFSMTGDYNTAIGMQTLLNNTMGDRNTAIGMKTLLNNTTGNYNTAAGSNCLSFNEDGTYNTAVGAYCLWSNIGGNNNTAMGHLSLENNSYGDFNTAIGIQSLRDNTSGSLNVAAGAFSLTSNTTGSDNLATGFESLLRNRTGSNNTAVGYSSLSSNTTGNNNTALFGPLIAAPAIPAI